MLGVITVKGGDIFARYKDCEDDDGNNTNVFALSSFSPLVARTRSFSKVP